MMSPWPIGSGFLGSTADRRTHPSLRHVGIVIMSSEPSHVFSDGTTLPQERPAAGAIAAAPPGYELLGELGRGGMILTARDRGRR
jgi:hypothetical protein